MEQLWSVGIASERRCHLKTYSKTGYTKVCNQPQPPTTIRNHPQLPKTIHNHPQPSTFIHNHKKDNKKDKKEQILIFAVKVFSFVLLNTAAIASFLTPYKIKQPLREVL